MTERDLAERVCSALGVPFRAFETWKRQESGEPWDSRHVTKKLQKRPREGFAERGLLEIGDGDWERAIHDAIAGPYLSAAYIAGMTNQMVYRLHAASPKLAINAGPRLTREAAQVIGLFLARLDHAIGPNAARVFLLTVPGSEELTASNWRMTITRRQIMAMAPDSTAEHKTQRFNAALAVAGLPAMTGTEYTFVLPTERAEA